MRIIMCGSVFIQCACHHERTRYSTFKKSELKNYIENDLFFVIFPSFLWIKNPSKHESLNTLSAGLHCT